MATIKSERLADGLFLLIERDQGKAFISDGIGNLSEEQVFAIARQSLAATERVAIKLRKWLKVHGQLEGKTYSELKTK